MEKQFDINEGGFSIRCRLYFKKDPKDVKRICIYTHGFGGNKDNKSAVKFAEKYYGKYKDAAVLVFDWPCHGQDARNKLLLEDCLEYLGLVISYAKENLKAEKLHNYSMSFGAYVSLLYIRMNGNPFEKLALRSPSVRMYESITRKMTQEDFAKLARGKELERGYGRKLRITAPFIDALEENNLMEMDFMEFADDILLIHGTNDDMVPIEDTAAFSEQNVIEMIAVEKANHIFQDPKTMDIAIHAIIGFFGNEQNL